VNKKGTLNVNFSAENYTKNDCTAYTRVGNNTENTYAYWCQRERLQGMLLTANEDSIMQTQKQSAIDSPFSACREYIE